MESKPALHPLLGKPIRRFNHRDMRANYIAGVTAFLFGVFALWVNYLLFSGQMYIINTLMFIFIPLAVPMCFGLGVALFVEALHNRGASIQLYSEGIAYLRGADVREFRWQDIAGVRQKITYFYRHGQQIGQEHLYRIEAHDGRKLRLGNEFKDIDKLGERIQQRVTAYLLPQMTDTYDKGQTVAFGELSLNKEGVGYKNKYLSWAEIEGAQISNGVVTFKKQGRWLNWARLPAAQIPNVRIFLALVDYAVGLKRGS